MPSWCGQGELYLFLYLIYLFIYIYLFTVCLTALLEIQSIAFTVEQLDY